MQTQEHAKKMLLEVETPEDVSPPEVHKQYRLGLKYGHLIYRLRWFIIAFWAVIVIVSVPFAAQIDSVLTGGGYSSSTSESAHASTLLQEKLQQPATQLLVVFQSTRVLVSDPAYQKEVTDFMQRARSYSNVTGVTQSGAGRDQHTIYVTVNFNKGSDVLEKQLDSFRKLLPGQTAANPAQVYLTGEAPFDHDFTNGTLQETERAEMFALPVALLVLLLVFGSLVAAAMPILLAVVAIPVTLAVIYGISLHISMSVFVLNITSIIGLGISIDYSLFMIRRYRDELANGHTKGDAIGWTIATAGESILFSGLIVTVGFCGLLLMNVDIIRALGIGGAGVVITALLAALTLLPALLCVLEKHIDALHIPTVQWLTRRFRKQKSVNAQEEGQGFWHRWATSVMKRPVMIILLVMALLSGLSWPIFSLSLGSTTMTTVPKSVESRQGMDILNAQFPVTSVHPVSLVVQSSDGSSMLSADNLAKLDHLSRWVGSQSLVTGVISLTQTPSSPGVAQLSEQQLVLLYSTGAYQQYPTLKQFVAATTNSDVTVITVTTKAAVDSYDGKMLINHLRTGDKAAAEGLTVLVGGDQAKSVDFTNRLYSNFPWAIASIIVTTYLLLLLMFRSVFIPLKAILMNGLSVTACLGVLVFIFQWGNLSNVLGFTSDGFLDSVIPILLFCILFGLSMDYEVFLLSRVREEWLLTQKNQSAVAYGLEKTGGAITNAALLFVIVAGAFIFTSVVVTKEVGLGMTVAVLVDATVVRALLVPATMRLLGRWNWWMPGRPLPPKQ